MINPLKSDFVKMIIMILTCVSLIVVTLLHSFGLIEELVKDICLLSIIVILLGFLIYGIKEFCNFRDKDE